MSTLRPFRFAFLVADARQRTGEDWEALAARAEALGYDTFGVSDHFGTPHAPLQVLQWVASCTSRIRLATLVLDNDFRHPAVLAKEAATVDVLSNGRLELGMGAGWKSDDYERSGIPLERGRVRLERLEEAVRLVKALWSEGPVSTVGPHYRLDELVGLPKPVQRPAPPIMIGGSRPRILSFAAREADIVSFETKDDPATWTIDALAAKTSRVREAAGGREIELHLNPDLLAVGGDRASAVGRLARAERLDPVDLDRSAYVLAGPVPAIVDHLERLREVAGISYVTIPSEHAEAFAPVVSELGARCRTGADPRAGATDASEERKRWERRTT
jgi:probable F420-dependent oxidoreductase